MPRRARVHQHGDLDALLTADLDRLAAMSEEDPARVELRNAIVERAIGLADRLARRFNRRGEPAEDLAQVARLALIRAVDGYRPSQGGGFTRYAVPTIAGELKRHFRDKTWSVRVPRQLQEVRLALNTAEPALSQELGRTPTTADLAAQLGVAESSVHEGRSCAAAYSAVSLQAPAESGTQIADTLGMPDPGMELVEVRQTLLPLLRELPPREQRILALRFGSELTQSQIAEQLHLSQMHVSRLISRSLAVLRERMDPVAIG
ncbi:SigB/SigF/SigG family RNA polymerase sigma factor [Longispora albida]|uniref:SigB/SigF/SigG family RNA polymerase sigma factor n=1 Tax=Longispora albida TaxID=203523 RepID=UPI000362D882|nr:SigB/SigF/SigG family RNA polymerase sigma factor [Longispora albida]